MERTPAFDDMDQLTTEDDADQFAESFQGTLAFAPEPTKDPEPIHYPTMSSNLDEKASSKLIFEITNTRIVAEEKDKHVIYTVSISTSHSDNEVATIHKRYSEFYHLKKQLTKQYPKIMKNFVFPKKKVVGNFTAGTIADRSKAFEEYLGNLASVETIQNSSPFANFFYMNDVNQGIMFLKARKYSQAAHVLQSAQQVQRKLTGDSNNSSIYTLCAVCGALWADKQHELALSYAELTLHFIGTDTSNRFLVPLVNLCIQLCWHLGKDKKDLEARLQTLKDQGHAIDYTQSLLDLVISSTPL